MDHTVEKSLCCGHALAMQWKAAELDLPFACRLAPGGQGLVLFRETFPGPESHRASQVISTVKRCTNTAVSSLSDTNPSLRSWLLPQHQRCLIFFLNFKGFFFLQDGKAALGVVIHSQKGRIVQIKTNNSTGKSVIAQNMRVFFFSMFQYLENSCTLLCILLSRMGRSPSAFGIVQINATGAARHLNNTLLLVQTPNGAQ